MISIAPMMRLSRHVCTFSQNVRHMPQAYPRARVPAGALGSTALGKAGIEATFKGLRFRHCRPLEKLNVFGFPCVPNFCFWGV